MVSQIGRLEQAASPFLENVEAFPSEQEAREQGIRFLFLRLDGVLALKSLAETHRHENPLSIDFLSGKMGFRLDRDRVRHEKLVKAVGGCPDELLQLVDGTAGLGRDSVLLATAGFQVTMLERSPILCALLEDAIERLPDAIRQRLDLVCADSSDWLVEQQDDVRPQLVYLDPMFPVRSKSSAVKKEMVLLQELLGYPGLIEEQGLLQVARARAGKKVIVKRPRQAPPLAGIKPASSLESKTIRFDIYPT